MHLSAAIFTEYSESTGDIFPIFLTLASDVWSLDPWVRKFPSSSLSLTREKRVSRSMAEEQIPLSQNTRGQSSFSPSPRHIGDSDPMPMNASSHYPFMLRPSLVHIHTHLSTSHVLHTEVGAKHPKFFPKSMHSSASHAHTFPQEFLQGESEEVQEKYLPHMWTKVSWETNCSGRYGINSSIPRSRWW